MARYILSNRRAGKFGEDEHLQSRAALGATLQRMTALVEVVRDFVPEDPAARRVVIVEADPAEMSARARELPPDVLLEPEILHWPVSNVPIDFIGARSVPAAVAPAAAGVPRTVTVQVLGEGAPLSHAMVLLFLRVPTKGTSQMQSRSYRAIAGWTSSI